MLQITKTPFVNVPADVAAVAKIGSCMSVAECDAHFKALITAFGVAVLDYVYRKPV